MKKEKKKPEADNPDVRVLEFHQRRFVVGLTWRTIRTVRNPMKEIKVIGKAENLDLVAVRQSDSIQAGFAPRTKKRLRGAYSLIVTLASLLEGCCIAVVYLGEDPEGRKQYTLTGKTEKGGIHPLSDKVFTEEVMVQTIVDLKAVLRGSKGNLDIQVYGDTPGPWVTKALDLSDLLKPQNLSKNFKLRPLTWGMTRNQLIVTGMTLVAAVVAGMVYLHLEDERENARRLILQKEVIRQEKLNREARYKTALAGFRHPWTEQPSVATFIHGCQLSISLIPLSLQGWVPEMVLCSQGDISVQFIRRTNSAVTTRDFVDTVKNQFSVAADFDFKDSSRTAFSLPHQMKPEGDDPMEPVSERLLNFISLFQALNIDLVLSPTPIKDVKKNAEGEDLPLQEWQEYTFSAETSVPPQMIFTDNAYTGIRLTRIYYGINNSDGSIRYKISGSLYGKR
ncbi:type 4b pilus protein PilO2 [Erwinia rhapontici]|uniref:type 4b pilus protein PilO2 n=1 Tax=Erwinia rhapontici TaxID=55212 RepID=UPI0013312F10|nr:type 4b pilus protein PilO2 [Erwinia rhapontici]MBP2157387.1 hypothetical protein [Erwinia rhapontici]